MAFFGFSKDDKGAETPDELVLAYLEDAFRTRSPFLLKDPKKGEIKASLHSLDEERGTFRLSPAEDLTISNGGKLEIFLLHEGMRLGSTVTAVDVRTGVLNLNIPRAFELLERRRLQRARLNPKESATFTALQGLTEGIGISGTIMNISEGGVRIRVEKALSIASEKSLMVGTKLVQPGQAFQILRLNKVPRCPALMECSGKAVYMSHDGEGVVMGFVFDKLKDDVKSALQGLVSSRCTPPPTKLPHKTRRKQEKKKKEEEEEKSEPEQDMLAKPPVPEEVRPADNSAQEPPSPDPINTPPSGPINWQEKRRFPRMSTSGLPYGVRFRLEDREVRNARLANLSASGCGMEVEMDDVAVIETGQVLTDLYLDHPDLPLVPLQAKVVRILGKVPGKTQGYALVGVDFFSISPHVQSLLAEHVEANIREAEA